jgi:hypothetical protein
MAAAEKSSRRPAVPGLIADVTVDYVNEFGDRCLQPFQVPVAPFCVLLQPIQALISPLGKKPSTFREFPDQRFQVREVTSQSSDVGSQLIDSDAELANQRVIFGLAFEQELNRSLEFISSHQ